MKKRDLVQQIVVIHGGTTFDSYEDYLSYLKNVEIDLERLKSKKGWKANLQEDLGDNFEVLIPQMPDRTNACYKEWKIWFERIITLLNENLIFIGHSLGGSFLAKYLSEEKIIKKIKATILVAAPFDDKDRKGSLADFRLPSSLVKFSEQGGMIYLIQSKDDPLVPFDQLSKYKKALPDAKTIIFDDREHFNQENFPEIIQIIKSV